METSYRAVYSDTLPFEVRLALLDVAVGSPVEGVYRVHISPIVEDARSLSMALSMAQLEASRGGYAKLRNAAKALVADATRTKVSEWEAKVGDFLVTVTRKG